MRVAAETARQDSSITTDDAQFEVRLARSAEDIRAAQRLRYRVFVSELGGDGPLVDHAAGLEVDRFDACADHLLLLDHDRAAGDQVVGVYRLMRRDQAAAAGQFYSEDEYDLGPLLRSGKTLLELGRSCVLPAYRGGTAVLHLWQGLAQIIQDQQIDILFGVASFHGLDTDALAAPLSFLHHRHLAPEDLRTVARAPGALSMDRVPAEALDRKAAVRAMPSLIKAYLRLGGFVGQGAYVDTAFNCIDVCLVLDVARMSDRHREIYAGPRAGRA